MQIIKRSKDKVEELKDIWNTYEEVVDVEVMELTDRFQISYNSHGHVVLRSFDPVKGQELLVVLTTSESRELVSFLRRYNIP